MANPLVVALPVVSPGNGAQRLGGRQGLRLRQEPRDEGRAEHHTEEGGFPNNMASIEHTFSCVKMHI